MSSEPTYEYRVTRHAVVDRVLYVGDDLEEAKFVAEEAGFGKTISTDRRQVGEWEEFLVDNKTAAEIEAEIEAEEQRLNG